MAKILNRQIPHPLNQKSYTAAQSGSQDGYTLAGGIWNDTSVTMATNVGPTDRTIEAGFVFDLQWDTDSEGILIDPPIIELGVVELYQAGIATGPPFIVSVWLVPEFAPSDFSNSLLPSDRSEILIGWGTSGAMNTIPDHPYTDIKPVGVFPISTTTDQVIGPGATVTVPSIVGTIASAVNEERSWEENCTLLQRWTRDAQWNGKLTLYVAVVVLNGAWACGTSENTDGVTPPTLTFNYWPNWSGVSGPYTRGNRTRVVRDDRYGMPIFTDEVVEDDFRPGTYVKPWDWDEDQDDDLYDGNPQEGQTDNIPLE
jgi:hypothetical protein